MQGRIPRRRLPGAWPIPFSRGVVLLVTLITGVVLAAGLVVWLRETGSNGGSPASGPGPVSVTASVVASASATLSPTTTAGSPVPTSTSENTPTPTPPTPTPSPTPTTVPFRVFAREIANAVATGDAGFFWSHARTHEWTCTPETAGWVYGCVGLPENAVVSVIGVANPFEGTAYREDQFLDLVSRWLAAGRDDVSDAFGAGTPVLYATAVTSVLGHDVYNAVITTILTYPPSGTYRTVLVSRWEEVDGRWEHVRLWTSETFFSEGSPSAEDWLTGTCNTGPTPCRDWARWP